MKDERGAFRDGLFGFFRLIGDVFSREATIDAAGASKCAAGLQLDLVGNDERGDETESKFSDHILEPLAVFVLDAVLFGYICTFCAAPDGRQVFMNVVQGHADALIHDSNCLLDSVEGNVHAEIGPANSRRSDQAGVVSVLDKLPKCCRGGITKRLFSDDLPKILHRDREGVFLVKFCHMPVPASFSALVSYPCLSLIASTTVS